MSSYRPDVTLRPWQGAQICLPTTTSGLAHLALCPVASEVEVIERWCWAITFSAETWNAPSFRHTLPICLLDMVLWHWYNGKIEYSSPGMCTATQRLTHVGFLGSGRSSLLSSGHWGLRLAAWRVHVGLSGLVGKYVSPDSLKKRKKITQMQQIRKLIYRQQQDC